MESTTDEEETLFEALYLNDELQQVVSKYEELEAAQNSVAQPPVNGDTTKNGAEAIQNPFELRESFDSDESGESEASEGLQRKQPKKFETHETNSNAGVNGHSEATIVAHSKESDAESSCKKNAE